MSTPTVRRYPRTLAEAWPREHANPIHFYPAPAWRRYARAAVCLAACFLIVAMAAQGV